MLNSQIRCLPANLFLAAICYWGPGYAESLLGAEGVLSRAVAVFGPLIIGGAGFFALTASFKVRELSSALRMVARRFAAKKPPPEPEETL